MPTLKAPIIEEEDGSISVLFDLRLYSLDAVHQAGYKFAADFAALLTMRGESELAANLRFTKDVDSHSKNKLVCAFVNEVTDQHLRSRIAAETEATRNLILAEAFSKTSLLREE